MSLNRLVIEWRRRRGSIRGTLCGLDWSLTMPCVQISATREGALVRHERNQRTRRPLGTVEHRSSSRDQQENILHEVVGLRLVPEDSFRDAPNHSRIAPEKNGQGLVVVVANPGDQRFVGRPLGNGSRILIYRMSGCLFLF